MKNKKIILIGAGNVAHHLAPALLMAGMNLCQIYSRSIESARELGKKTGITYTSDLYAVYPDGDIYIFCVSDDVILSLYKSIRIHKNALILHTSGSVSIDIFRSFASRYGVLYPLQTFSRRRNLNFREVPLCIEGSDKEVSEELSVLSAALSSQVRVVDSGTRKKLHLAAVFANNFVNRLYGIAGELLEEEGLEFTLLRPLIFETAHKVMLLSPEEAQTGPARRGDETILSLQKRMLKNQKKLSNLYSLMTDLIKEVYTQAEIEQIAEDKQMSLPLW